MKIKENKGEYIAGLVLVVAFTFMVFLYAPLETFFNNLSEFWFDLYRLLPVVLLMFGVTSLVGAALWSILFRFTGKVVARGFLVVLFIAYLCTYVQGNYMVSNLPPIDGSEIVWADYAVKGRPQTICLWIIVTVLVCVLVKFIKLNKFVEVVKVISICMTLMLAVTLVSVCLTTEGYAKKKYSSITVQNMFEMSTDTNVILMVLDATDAATMKELLLAHEDYRDLFEDFTYYNNTSSAYPATSLSVPYILSGEWFENEQDMEDYLVHVYRDSAFLKNLEAQNYKMGLYGTDIPFEDDSIYRFDNIMQDTIHVNSYKDFIEHELKLIGYRYAPFDFKKYCEVELYDFYALQKKEGGAPLYNWANPDFYNNINQNAVTYTDEKCFKFIHTEGSHVPYQYDKFLNKIENGTYEQNMEACLTTIAMYLFKLRQAEVYDNSIIMIMADHGGYSCEGQWGRQNPILFVKGLNEKHPFEMSEAPISFEDFPDAYQRLLDGAAGTEVFPYKEGDERERRFLFYEYEGEKHLKEYVIKGHASDENALVETGQVFAAEN